MPGSSNRTEVLARLRTKVLGKKNAGPIKARVFMQSNWLGLEIAATGSCCRFSACEDFLKGCHEFGHFLSGSNGYAKVLVHRREWAPDGNVLLSEVLNHSLDITFYVDH